MADTPTSTTTPTPSSSDQDGSITLHLTGTGLQASSSRIPIQVPKDVTSTQLRQLVSTATSIPLTSLRLIFRGRMIADNDAQSAVPEFKLENGSVLHCMGKPVTTTAAAGAPPAGATTTTTATTTTAAGGGTSSSFVTGGGSLATAAPAAAASASTGAPSPAGPMGGNAGLNSNPLSTALQGLRRGNSDASYRTAVTTLDKILSNIVDHPMEEKYRNLKVNNPAFQRRFGSLVGAEAVILACGFVRQMTTTTASAAGTDGGAAATEEPCYVLQASAESWPKLLEAQDIVKSELARVSTSSSSASPVPAAGAGQPHMVPPSLAGMGMGSGMPMPDSQALQNIMSNPAALQRMFQNPMVQSMMRNDPRLSSNPMMQQIIDELTNNPNAAHELAAMMSDPANRSVLDQAMRMRPSTGMGAMPPGGAGAAALGGFPRPVPTQQQQRQQPAPPQASDEDLTEEEMIAEAIRRSLQDGA